MTPVSPVCDRESVALDALYDCECECEWKNCTVKRLGGWIILAKVKVPTSTDFERGTILSRM